MKIQGTVGSPSKAAKGTLIEFAKELRNSRQTQRTTNDASNDDGSSDAGDTNAGNNNMSNQDSSRRNTDRSIRSMGHSRLEHRIQKSRPAASVTTVEPQAHAPALRAAPQASA